MSNIDVFTIDDDFDPLAEVSFEAPDDAEQFEAEYLAPIPDADKSVVPEPVILTAEEKIERLLTGLPGQQFRVLAAVSAAEEPASAEEIVAVVDAAYPDDGSIFDTAQILRLLTEAEALAQEGGEEVVPDEDGIALTPANFVVGEDGEEYLVVTEPAPATYTATEAGRAAVERHVNAGALAAIIAEEPRYKPIYARIMALAGAEAGATPAALDAAVDSDPLCEEPRRFCGYFLDKLESAGLVAWRDVWRVTDLGQRALATGILDEF